MGRRPGIVAAPPAVVVPTLGVVARAGGMPPRAPVVREPVVATGATGRIPLDGTWTVRVMPDGTPRPVRVPFSPNATRVRGAAGAASFEGAVAWYRTTLSVPTDGDYAIRFESVNHRATVYADGRPMAPH